MQQAVTRGSLTVSQWAKAAFVIFCLGAIASFFIVTSESFERCIKERKTHQYYHAFYEEAGLLIQTVRRVELHVACGRVTADGNDGAITALATIVVAVFTFTLWRSTTGMLRITEEQRADLERSIAAAEKSARAAGVSAEIAVQHQRPWLFISIDSTELMFTVESTSVRVKYRFENYGESIADINYYYVDIEIGDAPHEPRPILAQPHEFSESYVRPGGKTAQLEVAFPRIISRNEVRNIKSRDTRMWIVGFILYRDIFGDNHCSPYCYSYDPDSDIFVRVHNWASRNT
jgi:hypothetical protein